MLIKLCLSSQILQFLLYHHVRDQTFPMAFSPPCRSAWKHCSNTIPSLCGKGGSQIAQQPGCWLTKEKIFMALAGALSSLSQPVTMSSPKLWHLQVLGKSGGQIFIHGCQIWSYLFTPEMGNTCVVCQSDWQKWARGRILLKLKGISSLDTCL